MSSRASSSGLGAGVEGHFTPSHNGHGSLRNLPELEQTGQGGSNSSLASASLNDTGTDEEPSSLTSASLNDADTDDGLCDLKIKGSSVGVHSRTSSSGGSGTQDARITDLGGVRGMGVVGA